MAPLGSGGEAGLGCHTWIGYAGPGHPSRKTEQEEMDIGKAKTTDSPHVMSSHRLCSLGQDMQGIISAGRPPAGDDDDGDDDDEDADPQGGSSDAWNTTSGRD